MNIITTDRIDIIPINNIVKINFYIILRDGDEVELGNIDIIPDIGVNFYKTLFYGELIDIMNDMLADSDGPFNDLLIEFISNQNIIYLYKTRIYYHYMTNNLGEVNVYNLYQQNWVIELDNLLDTLIF